MIPTIALLMIVIIIARYFLGIGLTGIQELVMYMHALIFLGCAGYVQYKDEHVRSKQGKTVGGATGWLKI